MKTITVCTLKKPDFCCRNYSNTFMCNYKLLDENVNQSLTVTHMQELPA